MIPQRRSKGDSATTSLAGRLISCHADSGTKTLLRAFDLEHTTDPTSVELALHLTLNEDALGAAFDVTHTDHAHWRQGQQHAWTSQAPRHTETLLISTPSRARLFVDHETCRDATIAARPATSSVSTWATHHELFPLHASAVCRNGDGLLLVGEGGRGKTTTALALAMCGWNLIADDRCFVNVQDEALFMHSFYRTTIVTSLVANRFPELLGEHIGTTTEGKIASYLPTGIAVSKSARLRGLVLLNQQLDEPYQMTRLTAREALAAWQQTLKLVRQPLGPDRTLFSLLTTAARTVPAWQINLGWDFQMLDKTLRRHLNALDATSIAE